MQFLFNCCEIIRSRIQADIALEAYFILQISVWL
jgi:hypothetical protein